MALNVKWKHPDQCVASYEVFMAIGKKVKKICPDDKTDVHEKNQLNFSMSCFYLDYEIFVMQDLIFYSYRNDY